MENEKYTLKEGMSQREVLDAIPNGPDDLDAQTALNFLWDVFFPGRYTIDTGPAKQSNQVVVRRLVERFYRQDTRHRIADHLRALADRIGG